MSSSEDSESDVSLDDFDENLSDDDDQEQDTVGRGPWFRVMDPETFEISTLPEFEEPTGPVGFDANSTPFDYFTRFIRCGDTDFMERLVEETNLYATQTLAQEEPTRHARGNRWNPVTLDEMQAFIGLLLAMGIVRKPTYASYWETGNGTLLTETPNFRSVMSRNRFQAIMRFLHVNDNTLAIARNQPGYDPLHKIRPGIEFFNESFEQNYRYVFFLFFTYIHFQDFRS